MRKLVFGLLLIFLIGTVSAQTFPRPVNYISDFAGVVDEEWENSINALGSAMEANSTAQIFAVTVNDTSPYTAKEYATLLFNEWGVGQKGKDNGVLILLAFAPERRIEVETGYGVEGVLPDSRVGRVLDSNMDYFKAGSYGEGIYSVMKDLGSAISGSGEFSADSGSISLELTPDVIAAIIFIAIWAIMIIPFIYSSLKSEKCPDCGKRMNVAKREDAGDYAILHYKCKKCGKEVKKRVKKSRGAWIVFAGGFGGGGHGGFGGGGGMSGGGGAGRGF